VKQNTIQKHKITPNQIMIKITSSGRLAENNLTKSCDLAVFCFSSKVISKYLFKKATTTTTK
jgi:hypothetical protein